jgi:hypothetical protein
VDAISDFALFRSIVEAGGISAAALVLQSSPAAVSRCLTALEVKLGVRLAERSSRRFRLTDEGVLLYERSRSILEQVRDAEAEVASRGGAARGRLKVGAPSDQSGYRAAVHRRRASGSSPAAQADTDTSSFAVPHPAGLASPPARPCSLPSILDGRRVLCFRTQVWRTKLMTATSFFGSGSPTTLG